MAGSELMIDGRTCQTFEKPTTWSFESPVKVEKQSEAVVSLKVREISTTTNKKLYTIIRATRDEIPVYVKNRLTGKQVKRLCLYSCNLGKIFEGVKGFEQIEGSGNSVKHECEVKLKAFEVAEHSVELATKSLQSNSM
jgi:hypothetical protein